MKGYELPYMKEIAFWFIENTSLSAEQIADFCGLDEMTVQAALDGNINISYIAIDPIAKGYVSREEINKGQENNEYVLPKVSFEEQFGVKLKSTKNKEYISTLQKRKIMSGVAWVLKFHPEITDARIAKLTHSTTDTVRKFRDKVHKKYNETVASNPVTQHLCTQEELDKIIEESTKK